MLPVFENAVDFLRNVLIFNEFTDEELSQVAVLLNTDSVQAGKVIFHQGDVPDKVYIIISGEVRVTRTEDDGSKTFLAVLDHSDIFGEDALIFKRTRSATITAITDTELYFLTEDEFDWIRRTFPKIEPYLSALSQSHETARKLKIYWLNEEETISLVARRHPIRMVVEILVTAFVVSLVFTISIALITFLRDALAVTILSAGTAGVITLIGLIAGIWSFFEWRNDYFFVTNLRVVWRERILFRSASRQEIPLRTIQSLDVQTPNVFARMISVGDLIIRTFNSEMRLTDVNHPVQMKDMISAFLYKARRRSIRAEHAAIRRTIRSRLGNPDEIPADETDERVLNVQREKRRFQIFKTRIVEDGTITYRKHWWIFFKRAWQPTLAFILSIVICFRLSTFAFNILGLIGLMMLYFFPFGIFLWWLYQYEDWRNDIYRITKDRIIDRDKKPFGKESFRSAPIKNIQSVGHQIPNTLGLILNVGDVKINVGDETLTFDGVHDPALVHQDISRRMEELNITTERTRLNQEHERMATWLEIYYEETRGEFDSGSIDHAPDFQ